MTSLTFPGTNAFDLPQSFYSTYYLPSWIQFNSVRISALAEREFPVNCLLFNMKFFRRHHFLLAIFSLISPLHSSAPAAEPPAPLEPLPSANQLAWQQNELTLFTHFGMNTFTGRGTGLGSEDPKLFEQLIEDAEDRFDIEAALAALAESEDRISYADVRRRLRLDARPGRDPDRENAIVVERLQ